MDKDSESSGREADRVYDDLRQRILTLKLDPGAALEESRIVEEIGTSRTPVREAVIRLVSEGLLRRDGRQVRVSSFEVSQLRAFFEAMTLLSRAVNRMAAARRTERQLKVIHDKLIAFERELPRGDEVRISEANHAFHTAMSEAANSVFIQGAYEDLLMDSLRLARQCFAEGEDHREHLKRTVKEHREIYDAVKQRDGDRADRVAKQHSLSFRERLSRQMLGASVEAATIQLDD